MKNLVKNLKPFCMRLWHGYHKTKMGHRLVALFAAIALILVFSVAAVVKNRYVPLTEDQVLAFQPIAVLYEGVIWHPVDPSNMQLDSVTGAKLHGQEFISDPEYPAAMKQQLFDYYTQTFKKPLWEQQKVGPNQLEFMRAENGRKYYVDVAAFKLRDGTSQFRAFYSDPVVINGSIK